jgi:hypothetical protein
MATDDFTDDPSLIQFKRIRTKDLLLLSQEEAEDQVRYFAEANQAIQNGAELQPSSSQANDVEADDERLIQIKRDFESYLDVI